MAPSGAATFSIIFLFVVGTMSACEAARPVAAIGRAEDFGSRPAGSRALKQLRDSRSAFAGDDRITPFVVNGLPVPLGQKLYMASLRRTGSGRHFCGGALIHPRFILTAAHCLDLGDSTPEVHLGRRRRSEANQPNSEVDVFRTVSVHQHPSWSGDLRRGNDIALLKLDRDAKQQPLKLPDNPVNVDSLDMLEIIGWGETESGTLADDLMLADVDIFPRSLCNSPMLFGPFVSDSMLCAGGRGRDSCVGDSGGPIVDVSSSRQEVVVGITSFGKTGVCGEPGTPTVYTLINPYLDWIKSVTGLTKAPAPRPQPSPASPLPGSNSGWNSGWWRPDVLEYLQVSQAKNNCASGGDDWKPDGKANGCGFCKTLPSATQIADCLECCCTTGNMAMQWSYPGCPGVQGSPTRVGGNELSSQPWPQWPSTGGWSQTATTWNGYGRQYP